MLKIVCQEDDKYLAELIVKAVQNYGMCPPVECHNPSADCKRCIADWLEIEVIKENSEQEGVVS